MVTLLLSMRSEEHTSELQSRQYLVCRLLLEKKNLVYVARVVDTLQALLNHVAMFGVGRSDEEVLGGVQPHSQFAEALCVSVSKRLRDEPLLLGGSRELRDLLVRARQEEGLLGALAVVARDHVGGDGRVGVPDVGPRVDVVYWHRDVDAHERLIIRGALSPK